MMGEEVGKTPSFQLSEGQMMLLTHKREMEWKSKWTREVRQRWPCIERVEFSTINMDVDIYVTSLALTSQLELKKWLTSECRRRGLCYQLHIEEENSWSD